MMFRSKQFNSLNDKFSAQILSLAKAYEAESPAISAMLHKNVKRYAFAASTIADLPESKQLDVVDWGCGLPILSYLLKDQVRASIAYEPFATEIHREFAEAHGIELLETTPPQHSCDVISLIEVIEHLPILNDVIPCVAACLRPGGYLILTTPNGLRFDLFRKYLFRKTADPVPITDFLQNSNTYELHRREYTAAEIRQTMSHFGFEIVSLIVTDLAPTLEQMKTFRAVTGHTETPPRLSTRLRRRLVRMLPANWQSTIVCCARKAPSADRATRT